MIMAFGTDFKVPVNFAFKNGRSANRTFYPHPFHNIDRIPFRILWLTSLKPSHR